MEDLLTNILNYALTPSLIIGACAYLIKTYLSQMLDRDLESFKERLKYEAEVAKDRMQHDFNLKLHEHETKFSLLHQKQAETIAKVYELLVKASDEVNDLVNREPSKEYLERTNVAVETLEDYYRTHELYFEEDTRVKMDEVLSEINVAYKNFKAAAVSNRMEGENEKRRALALKKMQINVPLLKKQLANLFQKQLAPEVSSLV